MRLALKVAGIVMGFMAFAYLAIVDAEEPERHRIVVGAVSSDGVTVFPTPTPTATPAASPEPTEAFETTPIPIGHWNPDVERWRPLVAAIFPAWAVDEALEVIQRESEGIPYVYNRQGSGACGLFQLLPCTAIDPEGNVRGAYEKWMDGGGSFWRHWYQWW